MIETLPTDLHWWKKQKKKANHGKSFLPLENFFMVRKEGRKTLGLASIDRYSDKKLSTIIVGEAPSLREFWCAVFCSFLRANFRGFRKWVSNGGPRSYVAVGSPRNESPQGVRSTCLKNTDLGHRMDSQIGKEFLVWCTFTVYQWICSRCRNLWRQQKCKPGFVHDLIRIFGDVCVFFSVLSLHSAKKLGRVSSRRRRGGLPRWIVILLMPPISISQDLLEHFFSPVWDSKYQLAAISFPKRKSHKGNKTLPFCSSIRVSSFVLLDVECYF